MRRFLAIGLVWLGCTIAWMILGSTLMVRSGEVSRGLMGEVHDLWGTPMVQLPPRVSALDWTGGPESSPKALSDALDGSNIVVDLDLEQRKKGLLWFPTYAVDFQARYRFVNTSPDTRQLQISFPLETSGALYDGFGVQTAEGKPVPTAIEGGVAKWTAELGPGQKRTYLVKYRSRGTHTWSYRATEGTGRVRDFQLALNTDFEQVDFPAGTLSPTRHHTGADAWHGQWQFSSLVASAPIGVELPQKLNPGPLAAKITFFAPIGLLFFFFVVAIFAEHQQKNMHPLNYFFIGCAFFSFHLLFAYLVDHVSIGPAFALASAVSIALVASYSRLVVGLTFALREMGIAQLIYLVLFSFTFFWSGFTGLTITVGAIVTLAVMMQVTARSRAPVLGGAPCAAPYRCRSDLSA